MVKTIYPEETLSLNDWFKYIYTRNKVEYIEEKNIKVDRPLGFFKVYTNKNLNFIKDLFK